MRKYFWSSWSGALIFSASILISSGVAPAYAAVKAPVSTNEEVWDEEMPEDQLIPEGDDAGPNGPEDDVPADMFGDFDEEPDSPSPHQHHHPHGGEESGDKAETPPPAENSAE